MARQKALGRCRYCVRPLDLYASVCNVHGRKRRERSRKYYGYKPWRPGGHGTIPYGELRMRKAPDEFTLTFHIEPTLGFSRLALGITVPGYSFARMERRGSVGKVTFRRADK